MELQNVVDGISAMACIMSVEDLGDGKYGKMRIECGNRAYIDSIEHPAPGTEMIKSEFVPGSEYTDYLQRDLNFEDFCYRAAVKKKCLHSYVSPDRMDVWFNMTFMPVEGRDGNKCYCAYIMEIDVKAQSENISNIDADTASSVLDTCIRLRGTNDFKATMGEVISNVRNLCAADHCCVLIVDDLERTCQVLGEAFGEGSKLLPMSTYLDDDFYDIADSWKDTIAGSNCLIAKNEQDMQVVKERNPAWYESLTAAGVYNIVLFPLKSRNQVLGYMWALNFDPERAVKIKETLEVTTFIIGSELGNYLLLDRLKLIGSKDMLTGVMNRNEMNNFVDDLARGSMADKSVGVIFADLNGLKTVNDANGHNAGDVLLKNAAGALRTVFKESEIFRAGGDEFAVIVTDITEEELAEKIEMIRNECPKYNDLSFALGGSVESNSSNVRMALRRADENMYEDKRKFYEQFPDLAKDDRRRRIKAVNEAAAGKENREDTIYKEMNYDFLTGLPSMTHFFKLSEQARKEMHDNNIPSALVFINMKGMRHYNLKYGFSEGDVLIRCLAQIIVKHFGSDCCSRFGQDQFGIYTEAEGLDAKLKKVFREMRTANDGKTLPVRAGIYLDSMGIVESALACDRAKYACSLIKGDEKSHLKYFDEVMLSREINTQYVINNLDRAINENWIVPFYQPIVRTTGRKVCDEEALARWIDPVKGMLSPADFIPILEDEKLIYKVDLHILDVILERMRHQMRKGITVVPVSVNLSRTDFECCDIVQEITNRVDVAGISRELITIEITESVVGKNFDFMKEQIRRFQELGFQVWMDDFGSGYSSLDLLQEMKFDLIKFDMRFMRQFETSPRSRVILTELMRMAISLGIETVTEGVETQEQVEFLSEIGCTKMQGYYFCKPISGEEVEERQKKGTGIGYEDPDESGYHKAMGEINLYDLGAISNMENENITHYFNTIPMAVVEYDGKNINITRSNKSYREFVDGNRRLNDEEKVSATLTSTFDTCTQVGQKSFINDTTAKGDTVNAMIRKIADNPVNGKAAYAVAVLGVIPKSKQGVTYTGVAKALSADYLYMYLVDLDTEKFTEYSPDAQNAAISVERRGEDFFANCRKDSTEALFSDDIASFNKAFTKENIIRSLDETGSFTIYYRLLIDGEPTYVNLKAVRLEKDSNRIIIGVNNVDAQMREQEALERLKAESATYSRVSALMGDFIGMYTVDPDDGSYMEYSASTEYSHLGSSRAGLNFFEDAIKEGMGRIHPDDIEQFIEAFTKENVLEQTEDDGVFKVYYRLNLSGSYVKICLRAGMIVENGRKLLIVGVQRSTDNTV